MVEKESFLDILLRNSPEEINELIRIKGKRRDPINALIFYDDNGSAIEPIQN